MIKKGFWQKPQRTHQKEDCLKDLWLVLLDVVVYRNQKSFKRPHIVNGKKPNVKLVFFQNIKALWDMILVAWLRSKRDESLFLLQRMSMYVPLPMILGFVGDHNNVW